MPYKDPAKRSARQKIYDQTPAGKASRKRRRDRYAAKKRGESVYPQELTVDPKLLTAAMSTWKPVPLSVIFDCGDHLDVVPDV
jgi:hypothetical protein